MLYNRYVNFKINMKEIGENMAVFSSYLCSLNNF